jgi:colicin import membrane protein
MESNLALVEAPDVEELEFESMSWPERAKACAVTNDATAIAAGEMLTGIKTLRARIAETMDPIIRSAHNAHRVACDQKKTLDAPLLEAETTLKRAIGAWTEAEDRRRREEEARLREIARKAEEDARVAEAADLEAAGEGELAQQVLEMPAFAPSPTLPKPAAAAGVTTQLRWKAELVDLRALCRAVADGTAPIEAVSANMPTLNRLAVALKQSFNVPGVRAVSERSVTARARA